ncbi:putative RING-H2 finger protein ATL12 [Selaginella moellendorffii]|nr:putative RING-H2 finger protein ATL12 [Selaginella moellendorffii]|eukprot:XP_024519414.1 putative RING-H2 finger protein ATL12 [Selaginella moellendorffii]
MGSSRFSPAATFRFAAAVAAELAASPQGSGTNQTSSENTNNTSSVPASFRPSIAVIVGVLTTMFSLTFLLLIYAKHCKRNPGGVFGGGDELPMILPQGHQQQQLLFGRTDTGIDSAVVEGLPTFSFSSLKGNKDGLECAVCLCKYEEREILRLLPKCKHAFHVDCVDTWLGSHSTCPLCRSHVSAEDLLVVDEMMLLMLSSRRRSLDQVPQQQPSRSSLDIDMGSAHGTGFQIYIQREDNDEPAYSLNAVAEESESSGFVAASSTPREPARSDHGCLRRVGHRIIVSDVLLQRRWSDLVPSDVLFLGSSQALFCPSIEHTSFAHSKQPSSLLKRALSLGRNVDTMGSTRSSVVCSQRCMSEMTGLDRLHNSSTLFSKKDILASSTRHQVDEHEEASRVMWRSIARRTLNWLMRRESSSSRIINSSTTSFPWLGGGPYKHSVTTGAAV